MLKMLSTLKYDLNVESLRANVSLEFVFLFLGPMMPMNVTAMATSPTTINVRWEPPPFVDTIDHYFISWTPVGLPRVVFLSGGMEEIDCVSSNTPLLGRVNCTDVMEFNITGLEEHIEYQVMVLASNDVGNSTSGMDTERTLPDGEYIHAGFTCTYAHMTNKCVQLNYSHETLAVIYHTCYICSIVCTVLGSDIGLTCLRSVHQLPVLHLPTSSMSAQKHSVCPFNGTVSTS